MGIFFGQSQIVFFFSLPKMIQRVLQSLPSRTSLTLVSPLFIPPLHASIIADCHSSSHFFYGDSVAKLVRWCNANQVLSPNDRFLAKVATREFASSQSNNSRISRAQMREAVSCEYSNGMTRFLEAAQPY